MPVPKALISLEVQNIEGELQVDSRLIADCLLLQHRSFMKTLDIHLTSIEQFGQLRFESTTVTNSVGAVNTVKYAMLNEDQATFVMTLSKNTEAVIAAKLSLVKAFSSAKKIIEGKVDPIEALHSRLALEYEKNNYRPWRKEFPEADARFRKLVSLPDLQEQPKGIEQAEKLPEPPSDREKVWLGLIQELGLAANRAGLAGNKSIKEAEFLAKQLDRVRELFEAQSIEIEMKSSDIARLETRLHKSEVERVRISDDFAMSEECWKGTEKIIGQLEARIRELERELESKSGNLFVVQPSIEISRDDDRPSNKFLSLAPGR